MQACRASYLHYTLTYVHMSTSPFLSTPTVLFRLFQSSFILIDKHIFSRYALAIICSDFSLMVNKEDLKTIHSAFNSSLKNIKKNIQELHENMIMSSPSFPHLESRV